MYAQYNTKRPVRLCLLPDRCCTVVGIVVDPCEKSSEGAAEISDSCYHYGLLALLPIRR